MNFIINIDKIFKAMGIQQQNERSSFGNRMTLCAVAICLMWLTSLRSVVSLVGFFIPAPTESSVHNDCHVALQRLNTEKENHKQCAEFQLDQCYKNLDSVIAETKNGIQETQQANEKALIEMTGTNEICRSALSQSSDALAAWGLLESSEEATINGVNASVHGIQYTRYPAAGVYSNRNSSDEWEKKHARCRALVGDAKTDAGAQLKGNSSQYVLESDSSVSRVVAYSVALEAYNRAYVLNKTATLRLQTIQAAEQVPVEAVEDALSTGLQALGDELQMAIACLSLTTTAGVCRFPDQGLVESFAYYSDGVSRLFSVFATEVAAKGAAFTATVNSAIAAAEQFYDAVSGTQGIILYIQNSFPGVSLCGHSSPDFCQFNPTSLAIGVIDLPSLGSGELRMPTAAFLWDLVEESSVAIQASFAAICSAIREENTAFYHTLHEAVASVDFSADDYSPPVYADYSADGFEEPAQEEAAQKNRTQEYEASVRTIVDGINSDAEVAAAMLRASLGSPLNATVLQASMSLPLLSELALPFESSVLVRLEEIATWLSPLLSIRTLLFLFDGFYRLAQTVRLVTSYWGNSAAEPPPVDIRDKNSEASKASRSCCDGSWSQCLHGAASWFLIFAATWAYVLLFFLLVGLILYVLTGVYMLEYNSYVGACVSHSTDQSHLSAFLGQLALLYSTRPGHESITRGVGDYNLRVSAVCGAEQQNASAQSMYGTQMRDYLALNRTRQSALDNVALLFDCVNMTAMDLQFSNLCGAGAGAGAGPFCPTDSSTGRPLAAPSAYIMNETRVLCYDARVQDNLHGGVVTTSGLAVANSNTIEPDGFNCTALPSCKVTCSGPDPVFVRAVVKQCSCMSEWYINSTIFQVAIAVVVYAILQCSRTLFCSGLVMINFELLSAGGSFQVISECHRADDVDLVPATTESSGCDTWTTQDVEFGEKSSASGTTTDINSDTSACTGATAVPLQDTAAVQTELEAVVERYKRSGWWYILAGVSINMLWVTVLFFARRNMAYDTNE